MKLFSMASLLTFSLFLVLSLVQTNIGQTTAFTYQGNLSVTGTPANGNYDFEFALFDAAAAGTQLGTTQTVSSVAVANGSFTVTLDFGSQFPGANRFIEIRVRQTGQPSFTALSPRRPISSAPYAIKSVAAETASNALSLGGVAANQYVLTGDARLSDARNPLPGNASYIQNRTTEQASSNFNISGNGTVGGRLRGNIVHAGTQFDILSGSRVLFADNSAFNTFVGINSGVDNTTGEDNSFFGRQAGFQNTTGSDNSFFGKLAGNGNIGGSFNTFFGSETGSGNTTGTENTFVGNDADFTSLSVGGDKNTLLGSFARVTNGLDNATAIGARASVTQSNSLVLGAISGVNGATANIDVGIGTTAPSALLDIATNGGNIRFGSAGCAANTTVAIGLNGPFGNCIDYTLRGTLDDVYINRPSGGEIVFREGNGSSQVVINPGGTVDIRVLGTTGGTALCRNADQEIAFCSSSLRYKKNIAPFAPGLSFVRQLQPISYEWKTDGNKDVGFGAEDVAKIDSRFVTYNDKGEVEGIKYDRLSVAFVNAFREQQTQIDAQKTEIAALKAYICQRDANAPFCNEEK